MGYPNETYILLEAQAELTKCLPVFSTLDSRRPHLRPMHKLHRTKVEPADKSLVDLVEWPKKGIHLGDQIKHTGRPLVSHFYSMWDPCRAH